MAAVLLVLPWLLMVVAGLSLCVLYEPGERIGTAWRVVLTVLLVALLATLVVPVWWDPLDIDCTRCGRSFYAPDRPRIVRTGRCPDCGHPVPDEDLEEVAGYLR